MGIVARVQANSTPWYHFVFTYINKEDKTKTVTVLAKTQVEAESTFHRTQRYVDTIKAVVSIEPKEA